ncbi:MAG TPA: CsbD family protein [Thermoanaerobaculia bacterium]|nr:CsbD family protein [Thermoanaerobaculia bacterium]
MDRHGNRTPEDVAIENRGRGILNQMKGNIREAWGTLTGSRKQRIGGKMDRAKGRVQEGFGNLVDPKNKNPKL